MKKIFITVLLFFIIAPKITAQSFFDWKAHTSFRSTFGITTDDENRIWRITQGGIVVSDENQTIKTLTPVDGLSRLDAAAILYSPEIERIFVGYLTGKIDVINTEDFEIITLNDIERNVSFTQKGINDFKVVNGFLFVGTDFGLVQFDLQELFVKDSFLKFGRFTNSVAVYDIVVDNGILYIGTDEGIAYTNVDGNYEESDWLNYDSSNGYVSSATGALTIFDNIIYASTASENYKFENSSWSTNNEYFGNIIIDYLSLDSSLISLSERRIFYRDTEGVNFHRPVGDNLSTKLGRTFDGNEVQFGTINNGMGILNVNSGIIDYRNEGGPFSNFFEGMTFDQGTLISGSTRSSSGRGDIDTGRGFYIFEDEEWENYNELITPEFSNVIYRQTFTTTTTDDFYYFGSWGTGVVRFEKETGEIELFDETNSTLRGWPEDDEFFPVISGLDTDSNNDVWIVSRYGGTPLYRQTPGDDDWQPFNENSVINNADLYENLFIDSFDQKWIPLQNAQTTGTGLLIVDTKVSTDESDDIGVKLQFGSNSGNLPDNKVNTIVEDKNGEVWIGTERGIAKFVFPELIVEGNIEDRTAQWLINEDTTAVSRFLLRDINVTDMAVNEANEKWIGSANQGVYLLNSEGSKILKQFTTDNSPLFSNSIVSIAINDLTGQVFFATSVGLISYQDVPKKPVREMENLKVFPNPFNYSRNDIILIEGLSDETMIKVLGVDGTVVNSFESTGGRASWDAKDHRGNKLGSGVYFIVAVDSQGNSKGVGKIVIVQ